MSKPTLGVSIRDQFLLEFEPVFLNHGSFGATPRPVLATQATLRERMERNPVRFVDRELKPLLREAAARIGAFLGAKGEEIAFVDNATTGVNAVLGSLPFRPGDEIVTTSHVYGAVRNALRHHGSAAGLVEVPLPFPLESADDVVARVEAALTERTCLAVLDWISSAPGTVLPIERLVRVCAERGVPVLVDGAHCPGHVPVDLHALGCTWFVGNCHKWLFAPKGCAVLYSRGDASTLHPTVISHDYGQGFPAEFDFTGTKDPTPWLASVAGLAFLEWIGWERLQSYNRDLAQTAADHLSAAWGTPRPVPAELTAFLVTLAPPEPWASGDPQTLKQHLMSRGIEVPVFPFAGRSWVRISAQVYNVLADYERLAEAL